ncbi:hypothetical protein ANANG_G00140920 [Anguilla anguilla]|uniref:Uncharacterized protein n=1 Tax=Anguilla anguilla TaxID=7936 RepID=A0A9D3RWC3_ANGAN|nr:hypothetical protein ANANG_G00140920 [Anguilla anguilla]
MRSDPILFASRAMEELVSELRLFLDLLDREYLSAGVREKKLLISNILHRVLAAKEPSFKTEIQSSLPAPSDAPARNPTPLAGQFCRPHSAGAMPVSHREDHKVALSVRSPFDPASLPLLRGRCVYSAVETGFALMRCHR